ncbi:MAG: PBS lyase HEAT domain-containing protein [Candidatus Peregrinibacteria bacterium GW2011_GWC2_39_14]|nr:MAG: PBS lyase HEAT domain-containing protein [Candidatus Peregrinibacteria bacterium GW2011_GWC2_39_14]
MENTNKNTQNLSFFDRILNIYPHERSRVMICWGVRFIYRMAFILAWTMILSIFTARYHADKLPFLFVTHALLFILGSLVHMHLIQKYHNDKLIISIVVSAVFALVFALILLPYSFNLYLLLLLFVESFLIIQLTVFFDTFTERFFTPLESQRTFPLVESADTVAGIMSGLIFIYFSVIMPITYFAWILIGLLCALIPLVIHFKSFTKSIPGIKLLHIENPNKKTFTNNIKNKVRLFHQHSFAKNLMFIILLQYAFLIFVEYIYTGAVVSFSSHKELLPEATIGMENALAHTFGLLQLVFSCVTLLMQMFIGSRLISWLGIIGSMILYPVVMLMSMVGLVLRFEFFTVALTKINSEITSVLSRNSYQASYYAFREEESEEFRQFIDGMMRPLGTMCGAILLICVQIFVSEKFSNLTIVSVMLCLMVIDLVIVISSHKIYTKNSISALLSKDEEIDERLKSVEILMQKGHSEVEQIFLKCLIDPENPPLLKIKLLHAIAKVKYFDAIPEVISLLSHPQKEMRMAAIETIRSFQKLEYFDKNEFSKIKIFETLKSMFWKEDAEEIRLKILNIISKLGGQDSIKFILEILQNEKGAVLAEAIRSLRHFHDISLCEILEDYLSSDDPRLVLSAIISLSQFPKYKSLIKKTIVSILKSDKSIFRAVAAYAIGEIRDVDFKDKLKSLFEHEEDEWVKANAAVSMLKLRDESKMQYLMEILKDHKHIFSHKLIYLINEIPKDYRIELDKFIYGAALHKIHTIFKRVSGLKLFDMPHDDLKELRYCYSLLNSTSDILQIDAILNKITKIENV